MPGTSAPGPGRRRPRRPRAARPPAPGPRRRPARPPVPSTSRPASGSRSTMTSPSVSSVRSRSGPCPAPPAARRPPGRRRGRSRRPGRPSAGTGDRWRTRRQHGPLGIGSRAAGSAQQPGRHSRFHPRSTASSRGPAVTARPNRSRSCARSSSPTVVTARRPGRTLVHRRRPAGAAQQRGHRRRPGGGGTVAAGGSPARPRPGGSHRRALRPRAEQRRRAPGAGPGATSAGRGRRGWPAAGRDRSGCRRRRPRHQRGERHRTLGQLVCRSTVYSTTNGSGRRRLVSTCPVLDRRRGPGRSVAAIVASPPRTAAPGPPRRHGTARDLRVVLGLGRAPDPDRERAVRLRAQGEIGDPVRAGWRRRAGEGEGDRGFAGLPHRGGRHLGHGRQVGRWCRRPPARGPGPAGHGQLELGDDRNGWRRCRPGCGAAGGRRPGRRHGARPGIALSTWATPGRPPPGTCGTNFAQAISPRLRRRGRRTRTVSRAGPT